ncbi:thiol-disulfide isomerase/thioredoxin [Afipia massiliensis]|uniref:Thiol-disulfide isomerase/thioredoxin n=1 Tax=Afipia massiliensis TaxID=211460 RepID=A0A840N1A4_9BRAD|nr:thioredoxin family protein [Afipia massiliensis]MBB5052277.1 thiol-disulfide isomerase/thioredoxin [Afipia massiliensis]
MRRSIMSIPVIALALIASTLPGRSDDAGSAASTIQMVETKAAAPEFSGLTNWQNSGPLTIAGLRGKVVMVNFWTYGCVNCVNTLPHVTKLYAKYKDKGFVIVGVHTPEFPFERSTSNVQAALKRHGITYPVAQDNNSATWNAYRNQYWPAQYIVDQSGRIVYSHAGEGAYDEIDRTVGKLLNAQS